MVSCFTEFSPFAIHYFVHLNDKWCTFFFKETKQKIPFFENMKITSCSTIMQNIIKPE